MKPFPVLLLALTLAACGGKKAGTAPSGGSTEGDDAATPFNDGAVKAAIAATPVVEACGPDASITMGEHFAAQREVLTGGDATVITTESFTCRAQADNSWECQWAVFGEGGGSGYIIIVVVASDGTVDPASIVCNAPG